MSLFFDAFLAFIRRHSKIVLYGLIFLGIIILVLASMLPSFLPKLFFNSKGANTDNIASEPIKIPQDTEAQSNLSSDTTFTPDETCNYYYKSKALPIYNVEYPSDKKVIALSFDAAWGADDTLKILNILDKYNIKTTFFMTGGWINAYPDMVKEIYNRGHDLGNHSLNHKEMSKLSKAEQIKEISEVHNKIFELTGYRSLLFRPPYGDYNNTLIETLYSEGYYPIEWSVDSLDWKDYGTDKIINTVLNHKNLKPGAIVLMHNGAKYTPDALETIISSLISRGYEIIPISSLILTNNYEMTPDGTQKSTS